MARKEEVERKIRAALTTEFGQHVGITIKDNGGGSYAIGLSGVLSEKASLSHEQALARVRETDKPLLEDPVLKRIALARGMTPAQTLAWLRNSEDEQEHKETARNRRAAGR